MADFHKNTPLPIYNAIFYNNFEYYANVVKLMDYITTDDKEYYNLASIIDININDMNSYSNLFFINTLNNFKTIIKLLKELEQNSISKNNITNLNSLNSLLKLIKKLFSGVDTIFSEILTFEIRSTFFKQLDEVKILSYSIQEAKQEEDQYTEDYIISLNKSIKENQNYNAMVKIKINQVIGLLENAKSYIDMYYGIEKFEDNAVDKYYGTQNQGSPSLSFLSKAMFNFCIPKHYIRLCIIEDNKLIECIEAWCHAIKNQNLTKEFFNNKTYNIEIYEIHSISDYINVSLNHLLKNYNNLKRCKNCNKYFIPQNRTDEVYCNNPSPQNPNKTCKEYGAKKTYRDEIKSQPLKSEHNKTSQFYRMRINRAKSEKDKTLYKKKFDTYKEQYQTKKEQYQNGKLKEADFIEWIIKQKEGVKNGSTRNNKK